mmetsp:Transcript_5190/g.12325  ORF Transcript_5190/g.12325 Transcript_5190/m.12325 type:complete len:240 (+) Transcript_5190:60-779(+)
MSRSYSAILTRCGGSEFHQQDVTGTLPPRTRVVLNDIRRPRMLLTEVFESVLTIANAGGPPALVLNDPVLHVLAALGASLLRTEAPVRLNLVLDASPNLLVHPVPPKDGAGARSGVQMMRLADVVADVELADRRTLGMRAELAAHQRDDERRLPADEPPLHPQVGMLPDNAREEQIEGVVRVDAAEAEDGGKDENDDTQEEERGLPGGGGEPAGERKMVSELGLHKVDGQTYPRSEDGR